MLLMAVVVDGRYQRKSRRDLQNEIDAELQGQSVRELSDNHERRELWDSVDFPADETRTGRKGVPSEFIADTEDEELHAFVKWSSKFGKDYRDGLAFDEKMQNWKRVNQKIKETNDEAEASGNPTAITLEHNHFSDFTPE